MKEKRLLCVVMKDSHIYYVNSDNVFKQDKNCYIVTKYGSMAHPFIGYDEIVDGKIIEKDMYIGGYYELIEFLKSKTNDRVYLRGFNRATIGRIFGLTLENKSYTINEDKFASDKKNPVKVRKRKNNII